MLHSKMTRKEFLKMAFLAVLTLFTLPLFKIFTTRENVSYKDADFYKNLAG